MGRRHRYEVATTWTGDRGAGTADYRSYDRSFTTTSPQRPPLEGSSDPAFRGDANRWNPELLLVAALSECHLLAYLHRCASSGVVVTGYTDEATGTMVEDGDGGGHFVEVVLRPVVTVADPTMVDAAAQQHGEATKRCFIAASVAFPVRHEPRIVVDRRRTSTA